MSLRVKLGCVANLYTRQMHFENSGDIENGHTHPFDHLTLLASGSLKVIVNEKITEFKAPHMIYIRAELEHQLMALEDNTVAYCIHALRYGDGIGDILTPEMIPNGVDARDISKPVVFAKDASVPLKPFPSWVLNNDTAQWEAPVPMPESDMYSWDEETCSWVAMQTETKE